MNLLIGLQGKASATNSGSQLLLFRFTDATYMLSILGIHADGAKSLMVMGWAEAPALAMGHVLVNV